MGGFLSRGEAHADPTLTTARTAAVLAGLQQCIALLADRITALPRRFHVSLGSLAVEAPQLKEGQTVVGREVAFDCGVMALQVAKALDSAAEEARVAAAQLEAYAALLEREAEDEEERADVVVIARTLSSSAETVFPTPFTAIAWDSASLSHTIDAAVRLRDSIDPLRCTVSGDGLSTYHPGDFDNRVSVAAVDGEGDAVESIEGNDVTVCLGAEGASVTQVAVSEVGVVEVVYRVQTGVSEPVTVGLSVCGAVLPGSPWEAVQIRGSAILTTVAPKHRAAFLWELNVWLPRRGYNLLYRGSRDGMTAKAFHSLCDEKGPTLVLIRCDKGNVFGGYAGASWLSSPAGTGRRVASPDAFLFSVVGPHSSYPVRFPVVNAGEALFCHSAHGPVFRGGFVVMGVGRRPSPTIPFNDQCMCDIGGHGDYEDVLGMGNNSLTGSRRFTPVEIEVFAVSLL